MSEPVNTPPEPFTDRFELPEGLVELARANEENLKQLKAQAHAEGYNQARQEAEEEFERRLEKAKESAYGEGHRDGLDEGVTAHEPKTAEARLLADAAATINGARQDQYGNAEDSFEIIADFWSTYLESRSSSVIVPEGLGEDDKLDVVLLPEDVAMMMVLFKVARESNSPKRDNLLDIAGYAALAHRCVHAAEEPAFPGVPIENQFPPTTSPWQDALNKWGKAFAGYRDKMQEDIAGAAAQMATPQSVMGEPYAQVKDPERAKRFADMIASGEVTADAVGKHAHLGTDPAVIEAEAKMDVAAETTGYTYEDRMADLTDSDLDNHVSTQMTAGAEAYTGKHQVTEDSPVYDTQTGEAGAFKDVVKTVPEPAIDESASGAEMIGWYEPEDGIPMPPAPRQEPFQLGYSDREAKAQMIVFPSRQEAKDWLEGCLARIDGTTPPNSGLLSSPADDGGSKG